MTYKSGSMNIAATLLLPDGSGPFPAAVLIQGAGASSRKNLWALQFGEHLASRGIAAFMPDKQGTGDSDGDWKKADFIELANDIVAAVDFLSVQKNIDNRYIGVVGLSQGGFYAPIVATKSESVVFVAAVSSSVMSFEETINHEMKNTFYQDGLTGVAHGQAMTVQLAAMKFARDGNWEEYEKVRVAVLQSEAASAAEGFPDKADHWLWGWVSRIIDFDPMDHWKQTSQPVFFAFGEDDEEDNVPVVKSVTRINSELSTDKSITTRVYPKSGHTLYDPVMAEEGKGIVRKDFARDLTKWIFLQINR
jgi:pimeloyl-ACP methyl ester carboxylesterase